MFKDCVNGLGNIIEDDIREMSVLLVSGGPGTLKSGFSHSFLSNYLGENEDKFGVYASLEEGKESHEKNMKSLGIEKPENLQIFDYTDIRKEWRGEDSNLDMADVTENAIDYYQDREGENFDVFALDSLNALYSITQSKDTRTAAYHLFKKLREENLTSLITIETSHQREYSPSSFLADGIVKLGIMEEKGKIRRYFQLKKIRATDHDMAKHQVTVEEDGISIGGPLYE